MCVWQEGWVTLHLQSAVKHGRGNGSYAGFPAMPSVKSKAVKKTFHLFSLTLS